jgi:hypothetical protein
MEKWKKSRGSKRDIWIIGNSVLMDGVAACLEDRQITNLVRCDACKSILTARLHANKPILIIFEVNAPGSSLLLDLLWELPGLHLLGIDQDCDQVIVLNSIMHRTRTMTDLYQIVEEISGGWEKIPRGGNLLDTDEDTPN